MYIYENRLLRVIKRDERANWRMLCLLVCGIEQKKRGGGGNVSVSRGEKCGGCDQCAVFLVRGSNVEELLPMVSHIGCVSMATVFFSIIGVYVCVFVCMCMCVNVEVKCCTF